MKYIEELLGGFVSCQLPVHPSVSTQECLNLRKLYYIEELLRQLYLCCRARSSHKLLMAWNGGRCHAVMPQQLQAGCEQDSSAAVRVYCNLWQDTSLLCSMTSSLLG